MLDMVREFFRREGLLASRGVVAVSGGPDSVALAWLLSELCKRGELAHIVIAHLNHRLRSDESDADEAFVEHLPISWGMTYQCHTRRVDVKAIAEKEGSNLEACARDERYAWFSEVAKIEGASWIATGHTLDDQAETVLHRMLRGSGLQGIAGIPPRRPLAIGVDLIRPLLGVRRNELLAMLNDERQPFRIDSSNADLHFTRNRIRRELLPVLQDHYNPAVAEVLARLAEQARLAQREITTIAEQLSATAELPAAGAMIVLKIGELAGASDYIMLTLFRRIWQRRGWSMGDMNQPAWNRLVELVRGEATAVDLPGGVRARRVRNVLQLELRT